MKTKEIKYQLCSYDKRNPDYSKELGKAKIEGICYCDNCRRGTHILANELLRVKEELKETKRILLTDSED